MIEHNKNFYSLEELKRTKDSLEGYLDNEEVYYFVGAIRYACDEIERLIISLQAQEELTMKEHIKVEKLNNIINELENWLKERLEKLDIVGYDDDIFNGIEIVLDKLQEIKGSVK